MKKIQPLNIWQSGKTVIANFLKINISSDNLIDTAYLNYFLYSELENEIFTGTITIEGTDYKEWDGSIDSTYNWAANKFNVQLA